MKLVFVTNYVHHHQIPLADEFYSLLGDDYKYISLKELPEWLIKGGYDPTLTRNYIIRYYKGDSFKNLALKLINEADVVIVGSAPEKMIITRLNANKLTFRYAERYFKKRPWYFPDPRIWWDFFYKHTRHRHKNLYMLAASAYTANDIRFFFAYPNKCYKWGYFPATTFRLETKSSNQDIPSSSIISLMWCARFIKWKHPELPIMLAARLKASGYLFSLDMYGSGEELETVKCLAKKLNVDDVVLFQGNKPNVDIIEAMNVHDVFLFTSDKNEGWGAVLNESMSQGCAVVASDLIGAAPFLIENGKNGLLFKSGDIDSLYVQVKRLLDDDSLRLALSTNAVRTMQELWNPKVAAERFIHLVNRISQNQDTDYHEGPCSKAYPQS